jgi:hypothetical protein
MVRWRESRSTRMPPLEGFPVQSVSYGGFCLFVVLLTTAVTPAAAWTSTSDMISAHYLLVGRYMEQHFNRASRMNDAVKAEYEHTLRLRGQDAANSIYQMKGSYSDDLAAIIVRSFSLLYAVCSYHQGLCSMFIPSRVLHMFVPSRVMRIECILILLHLVRKARVCLTSYQLNPKP